MNSNKTQKENTIRLFQDQKVRTFWDINQEKWYFSIIDTIAILTDSPDPSTYWRVLKFRLKEEGNETVTNCNTLKMLASDGKMRHTDVADTEQLLRLIQSIPSKKAEPFKLWLAKVGNERIDELHDPELTINRALQTYLKKGYSKEWINQRLKTIEIRKELTDEWIRSGIEKPSEFAILTNEITHAWSGLQTKEYKQLKNLKKENLRDNMTNTELVLNMLAEVATKDISKIENPKTFSKSKNIAKRGGNVAASARTSLEKETKQSVISKENSLNITKNKNKRLKRIK